MRTALAIAYKELSIYFATPWAYAVFTAMAFISSFAFLGEVEAFRQVHALATEHGWPSLGPAAERYRNLTDGVIVGVWGTTFIVTLFVAPFLSMRLLAEERRHKTFELLMTTPIRPIEIVVGKYLGGLGIIAATLSLNLAFPVILSAFGASESGRAVEWPTVLLGFFGLLLWGATWMAASIGLFISALTESQMLAAILTFAVLLPWLMLRGLAPRAPEPLRSVIQHLAFDAHMEGFLKGVFELKSLVFFTTVIALSLLFTHRAVEAQRWAS